MYLFVGYYFQCVCLTLIYARTSQSLFFLAQVRWTEVMVLWTENQNLWQGLSQLLDNCFTSCSYHAFLLFWGILMRIWLFAGCPSNADILIRMLYASWIALSWHKLAPPKSEVHVYFNFFVWFVPICNIYKGILL